MNGDRWTRWAAGSGLVLLALLMAFPFYWAVVASLTPDTRVLDEPSLLPTQIVFDHYRALFAERHFELSIRNSLIVAGATTLLCMTLGSLCAYAIARMRFRGKELVLGAMLAVTMFPQISIVSPLYLLLRELGLINTYPGLILPYVTFAMPLAVWLLTGYFRQLPSELESAAMVDGAGRLRVLWSVVLPISIPGIATTAILIFVYCWNEFLFALSFTLGPERHTLPVAIALFRDRQISWGQITAAALVATTPVALLALAFQRRIIAGLTAGAIKG